MIRIEQLFFGSIKHPLLKSLAQAIGTAIVVGSILCVLGKLVYTDFSSNDALISLMFSLIISTCITSTLIILKTILKRYQNRRPWLVWLLSYIAAFLGMSIATELGYWMLSFVYKYKYHFLNNPRQLGINLVLTLVVTSIISAYKAQRENYELRIRQNEFDLLKLSQLKTQAELQTLQSKINPHFLYNALNSIASLVHEDPNKAEDMTLKLSKLFRYSINTQNVNFATVSEEVDVVNTYLAIEKVRFGERINFNSSVDETLLNEKMPRFLIQPLVENALKHGLGTVTQNGQLSYSIQATATDIVISVGDNGAPFPDELQVGYGLQSTFDKLKLLYGEHQSLEIINGAAKQIRITIPKTS